MIINIATRAGEKVTLDLEESIGGVLIEEIASLEVVIAPGDNISIIEGTGKSAHREEGGLILEDHVIRGFKVVAEPFEVAVFADIAIARELGRALGEVPALVDPRGNPL